MVFHGSHRNLYCCGDGALSLSAREMFWAFALPIQTRLGEGEQAATIPGTGLPGAVALHLIASSALSVQLQTKSSELTYASQQLG
jgi:hypothetical protein